MSLLVVSERTLQKGRDLPKFHQRREMLSLNDKRYQIHPYPQKSQDELPSAAALSPGWGRNKLNRNGSLLSLQDPERSPTLLRMEMTAIRKRFSVGLRAF